MSKIYLNSCIQMKCSLTIGKQVNTLALSERDKALID